MAADTPILRVVLVDEDDARAALLTKALHDDGHHVVARLTVSDDLLGAVNRAAADIVLVDMDSPARDTLDSCADVSREQPTPIVFFARDSDSDTIQRAVRAGVSAYVVDQMPEQRLRAILDVAIARFHEYQTLRAERDEARTRLADRKDIERAKALLMRVRQLEEEPAYQLLRSSAMKRRITMGEAARLLLSAAELFDNTHPGGR